MDKDKLMKILEAIGIATGATPPKSNSKFNIITISNPDDIKRVQNKKVMDVTEYVEPSPLGGKYKAWTGSTEMEFFSLMFMRGILTVSVYERECETGENAVNYGMLASLQDRMLEMTGDQASRYLFEYNISLYEEDMKNLSFNDVMTALNWEFHSDKVKVKDGMMFTT